MKLKRPNLHPQHKILVVYLLSLALSKQVGILSDSQKTLWALVEEIEANQQRLLDRVNDLVTRVEAVEAKLPRSTVGEKTKVRFLLIHRNQTRLSLSRIPNDNVPTNPLNIRLSITPNSRQIMRVRIFF